MNPKIRSLLKELEDFEGTEPAVGLELRLSLAQLLLRHLMEKNWTQGKLAQEAQMKEPQLSRIIHSDANCTLDTIGKLLFALGVRAEFQVVTQEARVDDWDQSTFRLIGQETTDGQEDFSKEEEWTAHTIRVQAQAQA